MNRYQMNTKSNATVFDVADLRQHAGYGPNCYIRLTKSAPHAESPVVRSRRPGADGAFKIVLSEAAPVNDNLRLSRWSTLATSAEAIKKLLAEQKTSESFDSDLRRFSAFFCGAEFNLRGEFQKHGSGTSLDPNRVACALFSRSDSTRPTADHESSLTELIDSARLHPKLAYGVRLAERLHILLEISRDEQPDQAPPALASVRDLIAFLADHPELAYPGVVLTQEGNVRIQWRRTRGEHFAVEFVGDGDVRFVIFAPDPKRPDKTARVSGSATVDSIMRLAEPYGVRRWAEEKNPGDAR